MGMLPDTPRMFLFGQTLGHERDGTVELRMLEFVCVKNRHEHNAEVILVKFHAILLPEPSEGPGGTRWFASHPSSNIKMIAGGHNVLEEVASRRHETPSSANGQ